MGKPRAMSAHPDWENHMSRRKLAWLALVITLCVPTGQGAAEPPDKSAPQKEPSLMRQKLEYANRILTGIATEDFTTIRQNAEALQRLTRLKEFSPAKPTEYRAQLLIFDFATSELLRLSKEKNLDGAALAYTQLALSCVNCHKQLRAP